jgi:hypothetical protein
MMQSRKPRPTNMPVVSSLNANEQAALDFARQEFIQAKNTDSPWGGGSMLSREASHGLIASTLTWGWPDVRVRLWLIMIARAGLRDAQMALQRIILEYQSRHERMPTELAAYDMEVKTFGLPSPAGPKKTARMVRDLLIMLTTMALVEKFGLYRTKRSPNHRSASEITAMALPTVGISMGYKSVEKIVDRYRDAWPEPGWIARMAQKKASYEN